jgi:hypothetical protein
MEARVMFLVEEHLHSSEEMSLSRCARLCGVFTVYSVCNVHNAELTQRVLMELVLKLLSIVS